MDGAQSIIVVDDDPDICETLNEYFSNNGFEVSTAPDGETFKKLLEEQEFSLAILDLRLPGEDGLSLCRFIRENHEMGVIMLTGSADSVDRVVGLEVGADDYVAKPFDLRELLARVRSVLRRSEASNSKKEKPTPPNREVSERAFDFAGCSVNPDGRYLQTSDGESVPLSKYGIRASESILRTARPGAVARCVAQHCP